MCVERLVRIEESHRIVYDVPPRHFRIQRCHLRDFKRYILTLLVRVYRSVKSNDSSKQQGSQPHVSDMAAAMEIAVSMYENDLIEVLLVTRDA